MKSMGSYYWYVKIPQCRYMEYGSKDIALYVQKHMKLRAVCQNFPLLRDKLLGAPASVRRVYWLSPEGLMNSTALSCTRGHRWWWHCSEGLWIFGAYTKGTKWGAIRDRYDGPWKWWSVTISCAIRYRWFSQSLMGQYFSEHQAVET